MKQQEEITIQSLANNDDVQIGYSDNDIVVVDSIQQFTEVSTAHVAMNAFVICTNGKVQAQMNGMQMVLHKNQVAVIPQNVTVTDVMVSPDFDLRGMFLTNRILQSFLHDKMNIWNDMMYIHRQHIVTMDEDEILFYTHFYDMLTLAIVKGKDKDNPLHTDIIQSLLRSAILALCGAMQQMLQQAAESPHSPRTLARQDSNATRSKRDLSTGKGHFQRFLDLLHSNEVKRHTVEAYASELCISPKYLTAVCKKNSGKTANEWITEQVLEDIRYYLRHTDLSIKQICNRLAFPNPSFFGKYVKDHFGMTPMEFRNS
jgi:AraC-like DNA-binding protein